MKHLKTILLMGTMALASSASAQFVNSSSASSVNTSSNTDGWDRVFVSYNPSTLKVDVKEADDLSMQGFTIGYLKGISITDKLPLFVEAGAGLQYRTWSEEGEDITIEYTSTGDVVGSYFFKQKINLLSLNIPVNIMYRWNVNNDFAISPLFGIDFRINMIGKQKNSAEFSWTDNSISGADKDAFEKQETEGLKDANLFDKDDMGKNGKWKRFQAGWHIGVNFDYKKFYAGVTYGTDFNEISKKMKLSTTSITVGYNF